MYLYRCMESEDLEDLQGLGPGSPDFQAQGQRVQVWWGRISEVLL